MFTLEEFMQRRSFVMQSLALSVLAATGGARASAQAVGGQALGFELAGLKGPVRLADLRGRIVFLDFWASWCTPCRLSFPWMNQMQATYGPQGLQVVAINVDAKRADADRFLAATPVQFAIAFDPAGDTPRAYGIKAMPSSFLIGTDGRVLHTHAGFRDADKADLEQRIRAALARA
jgi:thiol-disulfide isomerase/thioredoxin